MTRRSYVQINGVLYEKGTEPLPERKSAMVMPDIQPFRSPIDGQLISSRPKMYRHMKEHDVTRAEDYSPAYMEKKNRERQQRLLGQTPQDRSERIEALKYALEKHRG